MIVDRAPPSRAEQLRLETIGVGCRERQEASWRQDPRNLVQKRRRVAKMLDEVGGVHEVESRVWESGRFEAASEDGQAESILTIPGLSHRYLDPLRFPAEITQRAQQGTRSATDVQNAGFPPLPTGTYEERLRSSRETQVAKCEKFKVPENKLVLLLVAKIGLIVAGGDRFWFALGVLLDQSAASATDKGKSPAVPQRNKGSATAEPAGNASLGLWSGKCREGFNRGDGATPR